MSHIRFTKLLRKVSFQNHWNALMVLGRNTLFHFLNAVFSAQIATPNRGNNFHTKSKSLSNGPVFIINLVTFPTANLDIAIQWGWTMLWLSTRSSRIIARSDAERPLHRRTLVSFVYFFYSLIFIISQPIYFTSEYNYAITIMCEKYNSKLYQRFEQKTMDSAKLNDKKCATSRVTWGKTPTLRIHAHILITNGWKSLKLIHDQVRL